LKLFPAIRFIFLLYSSFRQKHNKKDAHEASGLAGLWNSFSEQILF
jgi:hypothetical protein